MSTAQSRRLPQGGRIDRTRSLRFSFDGAAMTGHPGDTLASALLANGVDIVGRSFKRHRPRGIFSAGAEEPNAWVSLEHGAHAIPCAAATQVELYDGLIARSLNCWPNASFDLGGVLDRFAALMPAGFYYKTFMWPARAWGRYEHIIRHAAGLARAPLAPDLERYERRFDHCDVLVIGAGPAGLAAAAAATRAGARILLVEERAALGGSLLDLDAAIDARSGLDWTAERTAVLESCARARILTRASAVGYHDHNLVSILERVQDHVAPGSRMRTLPRQRLWHVRARRVVLATGSFERPLLFANNDTPGVMLAHAAATYAERYAVRAGRRAVLFTDNDSGYRAAAALQAAGIEIVAAVDRRPATSDGINAALEARVPILRASAVVAVRGGRKVRAALVAPLDASGERLAGAARSFDCDLVCVAGGWNPAVHLFSQSGGKLRFEPAIQAYVPAQSAQQERSAGACAGTFSLLDGIAQGEAAGSQAAFECGHGSGPVSPPPAAPRRSSNPAPVRELPSLARSARKNIFVDILNDVSAADLALASHEGYGAPELAKRYTTAGMGVDQGRTGNINALAVLATAQGLVLEQLPTTTFRPPYVPIAFGAMAGRDIGALYEPLRRTPISDWHEAHAALMEPVGAWRRPACYPRAAESFAAAVRRECIAARNAVTLCDVSTLGKLDIHGPDAVRLLDMLYTNDFSTLKPGRARYGLMLKDDGMVFDDGTTSRLGADRYFMTTTSGHADAVADWIEEWLQCEWPRWRVFAVPVTTQWAGILVSGPRARVLLERLETSFDLARERCPFMSIHQGSIEGAPARLLRVSFTGELAYELYVPARYGLGLWQRLMDRGSDLGIEPIGTEALHVLRAEKGFFVVGHDADATVSARDLGAEWLISRTKSDFIGKHSLSRPELKRSGRLQFVGLESDDPGIVVAEGSPIVAASGATSRQHGPAAAIGRVTSSYSSPTLGRSIALAMVSDGLARLGEAVSVIDRGTPRAARLCSPRFYDPEGSRLHG
ncbi:MAG: sarcosine oxidase subunit alpha family protein [Burkholderiales bacterium]|nr:sarcosine oxidase subunit alpha family protein [Burkholderiales bacterium]